MDTAIKRHGRRALRFAAGTVLATLAASAGAATIAVDSTLDAAAAPTALAQGVCDDGAGHCTLRAAIEVADAAAAASVIEVPAGTFTLTLGGVDETPQKFEGVWSVAHTPDASRGDLNVTQSMTIVGAGSGRTIIGWAAGARQDRVFHIEIPAAATANLDVRIQGVTIENGYVPAPLVLDGSVPTAVIRMARMGGGIAIGAGAEIQTVDSTFTEGEEEEGGCGGGGGKMGGGACAGPEGHGGPGESEKGATIQLVSLADVRVVGNHAGGEGGGIYNTGPIAIDHALIAGNSSDANGGGLYNDAAMVLTDSSIGTADAPNSAANGGGLFETGFHTSVIERDAFVGNTAGSGGAIAGRRMVLQLISRSTIAANGARDGGAGIMTNGRVSLTNATVAANTVAGTKPKVGAGLSGFGPPSAKGAGGSANASNYTMINTIVAYNAFTGTSPAVVANCGGKGEGDPSTRFYSQGHNVEDVDTCGLHATADQSNVDPRLQALADNGGPTPTMAPMAGSPAIDAGDSAACPNDDQRGRLGHADGNLDGNFVCDVGAYELFVEAADLHIDDMTAPDTVYLHDPFEVTATIHVDPAASAPSTGVEIVTTPLPPELHLSAASVTTPAGTQNCTEDAGAVTCAVGTLAPGETATMTANLVATGENAAAPLVATATQVSPVDPDPNNNSARISVAAIGQANLSIDASRKYVAVARGGRSNVGFSVENAGPDAATQVRVAVTLPDNVSFDAVDLPGASCAYDDSAEPALVECSIDTIAAGDSVSGLLTVAAAAPGTGTAMFAVDAVQQDATLADNQTNENISVASPVTATTTTTGGGCVSRPGAPFDPVLLGTLFAGALGLTLRRRARAAAPGETHRQ